MLATLDKELPAKASELIMCALADLEKIEKDPRYKVRMWTYHAPQNNNTCYVCLAGCVMACGGITPDRYIVPQSFDSVTECKLRALDCLRLGSVSEALRWLGYKMLDKYYLLDECVVDYLDGPDEFKSQMRGLALTLGMEGL